MRLGYTEVVKVKATENYRRHYYFRIVASNGRILCHSENYTRKVNCIKGINAMNNILFHGKTKGGIKCKKKR